MMKTKLKEEGAAMSPYNTIKSLDYNLPSIIIVNPFDEANLGTISRGMLNFGFTDLRIVNPGTLFLTNKHFKIILMTSSECNHLSDRASQLAVGSIDNLINAKIFNSLNEAISDLTTVYATTARTRDMNHLSITPDKAADTYCKSKSNNELDSKYGIVFGRERSGLTNDELKLCHAIITIPTCEHYSVLNLAQAVNIVAYEFFKVLDKPVSNGEFVVMKNDNLVSKSDLNKYLARLEEELHRREYASISSNNNKTVTREVLISYSFTHSLTNSFPLKDQFQPIKNLYERFPMTQNELKMLQGKLTALLRVPTK